MTSESPTKDSVPWQQGPQNAVTRLEDFDDALLRVLERRALKVRYDANERRTDLAVFNTPKVRDLESSNPMRSHRISEADQSGVREMFTPQTVKESETPSSPSNAPTHRHGRVWASSTDLVRRRDDLERAALIKILFPIWQSRASAHQFSGFTWQVTVGVM